MALETYRKKRDFSATPEPEGRAGKTGGRSFVIQKHDATRLHYDFRLEMDGVLKSWAVTKGPSLDPGEKRLAVHVEDHPLDYGDFEGTIPKGQYGGGTVIVWDRGTWSPIGDAEKAYAKGHMEFELHGEKLSGRWHLVRMRGKSGEKRDNWLLIKGDDDQARTEGDILEELPESVKTGRQIAEVAEGVIVREGAVLAMGVYLSASTKIVDRATGGVFRGEVPAYSVVVPGALPDPNGGPSLYCAVIVKRVDAQTRAKTGVNELLRD